MLWNLQRQYYLIIPKDYIISKSKGNWRYKTGCTLHKNKKIEVRAMSKRLVIIHTTPVTIGLLRDIASEIIKDCSIMNILDDSILPEINTLGHIPEDVRYRFNNYLVNAATLKPDAILCACSSMGNLVDEGRNLVGVPVLRIDEPMAEIAVNKGRNLGVAATLTSTLEPTCSLVTRKAKTQNKEIILEKLFIQGVGNLINESREEEYDVIVSNKLLKLLESNDLVILAQASMARALKLIPVELREKFLVSPYTGMEAVKKLLGE